MNMKVDKQNGDVKYNDEKHLYFDDKNTNYISVTTLIKKYSEEFNGEFWSAYKALEVVNPEVFNKYVATLKNTNKFSDNIYKEVDIEKFNLEQLKIKQQWKDKSDESCRRGTEIHSKLENEFYSKPEHTLEKYNLGGLFKVHKNNYDLSVEKGIFPEYLIHYNLPELSTHGIAGQIDLLIKDGNDIVIVDYKTNEKITKRSFYDSSIKSTKNMKAPLFDIMDCNYYHYTLQLSLYAYMIQQKHPEFNIKQLLIIHYDHNDNITEYPIEYKKDHIDRLIKDYVKKTNYEFKTRKVKWD